MSRSKYMIIYAVLPCRHIPRVRSRLFTWLGHFTAESAANMFARLEGEGNFARSGGCCVWFWCSLDGRHSTRATPPDPRRLQDMIRHPRLDTNVYARTSTMAWPPTVPASSAVQVGLRTGAARFS